MTEDEAQAWIAARYDASVVDALAKFVSLVRHEAPQQNLVSQRSLEHIWSRHIVDSLQLIALAKPDGRWIDIGTGAGFPGMVTAIASMRTTILVEPRRRRVDFLKHVISELGIGAYVDVRQERIDTMALVGGVISARAVATVDDLLHSASGCADRSTQWLLPKGRRAREEVAQAKKSWHGTFHVEQSVTDPESMIVVANGISRR